MKRVSRASTLLGELMLSASACKHVISGLRDVAVSVSVSVTEAICDRDTTSQAIMLPVCPHSPFRRFVYGTHSYGRLLCLKEHIFLEIIIFLSEIQTIGSIIPNIEDRFVFHVKWITTSTANIYTKDTFPNSVSHHIIV